jgi:hypothetical protein
MIRAGLIEETNVLTNAIDVALNEVGAHRPLSSDALLLALANAVAHVLAGQDGERIEHELEAMTRAIRDYLGRYRAMDERPQ